VSEYETGGAFWAVVFRRSIFALQLAQATILGQFMLKGAWKQTYCLAVLMVWTYFFMKKKRAKFDVTSGSLPLEIAVILDKEEEEDREEGGGGWTRTSCETRTHSRP
jgi:hypothetical protein